MTTIEHEDPAIPRHAADEDWYDAEIAPALAALAKRCNERGMSFVAAVEYQPAACAGTYYLTQEAGLHMHMLNFCGRSGTNVDGYFISLARHCKKHNIDTGASFVMKNVGT